VPSVHRGEPFFQQVAESAPLLSREGALDFGMVVEGKRSELALTVYNDGRGDVELTGFRTDATFRSAFSIRFEPFRLRAGESQEVLFAFAPPAHGAY